MAPDGSVTLLTGAADLGTGTRTALAQIVAEELSIDPSRVRVVNADTAAGPYTFPSFGSMTIASAGPAARHAAHEVRQRLLSLAKAVLGEPSQALELAGAAVRLKAKPKHSVDLPSLMRAVSDRVIIGRGRRGPNPDKALHSFAAHACRVLVDPTTGSIAVTRYTAAHDSGRVINPLTWEGQVQGGVTMGLGYGLCEERLTDPTTGAVIDPGFLGARPPTIADSPWGLKVFDAGSAHDANPVGAKGIGEPPVIPPAAAVANAVAHALGVRIRQSPILRRRVLAALAGKEGAGSGAPREAQTLKGRET
jgi:xanthine dehydrogenase YagR molybdenum-binding subunit